jgi:hypothetical protein
VWSPVTLVIFRKLLPGATGNCTNPLSCACRGQDCNPQHAVRLHADRANRLRCIWLAASGSQAIDNAESFFLASHPLEPLQRISAHNLPSASIWVRIITYDRSCMKANSQTFFIAHWGRAPLRLHHPFRRCATMPPEGDSRFDHECSNRLILLDFLTGFPEFALPRTTPELKRESPFSHMRNRRAFKLIRSLAAAWWLVRAKLGRL